jgi:DNA-binding GntR family transcriptional regulator
MDDLLDTHKTRLTLESLAVREAAARFTEADAEVASAALAEHVRLTKAGDHVAARFVHTEFHFAIYRACGSTWLPRCIEPVWQNSERYRFGGVRGRAKIEAARLEHQAILDACIARDVDGAEAALRAHLEGVMRRITESMIARGKAEPAKESE